MLALQRKYGGAMRIKHNDDFGPSECRVPTKSKER